MKGRVAALPTRTLLAIAAGVVLVYAVALWLLLVSPKRAEAGSLVADVAAAELQLAEARAAAARPTPLVGSRVGDVLRLAKAMPASSDQSSLILELELLGRASGATITSIAPGEPVFPVGTPGSIPVVVTAEGSYRQITRFLGRARSLVVSRGGTLRARGRLLTVQTVELTESKSRGFPRLDATITFNAYVYDGPLVEATPLPSTEDTDNASTGATAAGGTP